MFSIFKKSKTPTDLSTRVHTSTHELFSDIGTIQTLALMHRMVLEGHASDSECNDLALGAYRTLLLASGVAHYRMTRESSSSAAADAAAEKIVNSSGLAEITNMILESVPHNKSQLEDVSQEIDSLFQAAIALDRLARKKQYGKAELVWRACAKGAYAEVPIAYAGVSR